MLRNIKCCFSHAKSHCFPRNDMSYARNIMSYERNIMSYCANAYHY